MALIEEPEFGLRGGPCVADSADVEQTSLVGGSPIAHPVDADTVRHADAATRTFVIGAYAGSDPRLTGGIGYPVVESHHLVRTDHYNALHVLTAVTFLHS